MSSLTDRLGLIRWTLSDKFKTSELVDNWNAIDAAPGTHICLSSARPAWGANQAGRRILETDTGLEFRWSGSAWVRIWPKGLVTRAERLDAMSTTSFTLTTVLATSPVAVNARRHLVIVEAPRIYNTTGLTNLAIFRDSTKLQEWQHQGATGTPAANQARGMSFTTTDQPTAGESIYSLQMSAVVGYGGASYMEASTNKPCAITLVEI